MQKAEIQRFPVKKTADADAETPRPYEQEGSRNRKKGIMTGIQ